jgi:hypothetical protein
VVLKRLAKHNLAAQMASVVHEVLEGSVRQVRGRWRRKVRAKDGEEERGGEGERETEGGREKALYEALA